MVRSERWLKSKSCAILLCSGVVCVIQSVCNIRTLPGPLLVVVLDLRMSWSALVCFNVSPFTHVSKISQGSSS